uniref:Protein phosphatase 1 regulatory subunit 35 C-terminal domain-containing protein n=1 Tax=Anopheles epiroticus TaxID=199890 RepID=A0A182PAR7_9DIPT
MGKNKHGKRKQLLSNVDVPVSRTNANVLKSSTGDNVLPPPPPKSILKATAPPVAGTSSKPRPPLATSSSAAAVGTTAGTASTANASKYKQPELYSTLGITLKIDTLNKLQPQSITSMGQLTPSSKKRVNAQATKQLNHQYDHPVFKRLPPVNVNDTVLMPTTRTRPTGTKARPLSKDKKDPEPVLSDYLRPIPPITFDFVPHFPTSQLDRVSAGESWNNFHNIEYVLRIMEEH